MRIVPFSCVDQYSPDEMALRQLEHLVVFTAVATSSQEEGEENLIVQLAWEIVSISKNQVGFK